jgi:enoyl-CoA hydratase/carnithine racemase
MLVELSIEKGIARICLNRPKKMNALNSDVYRELGKIITGIEDDRTIRMVVVTGNERAFAAGADIDLMSEGDVRMACELTDLGMRVQERLSDLPVPTLASISGYCLGGGLELALCCDFRIASDTSVLGLPEINLGIIPGGGGTQRLPRLVGTGPALKMIMLGETIEATQAQNIGLVDSVVPVADLEKTVETFATKLMKRPAMSLRAAKTAVKKGMGMSLKDGLCLEKNLFCMLFGTTDQKEGMQAFLEKRKPVFLGK